MDLHETRIAKRCTVFQLSPNARWEMSAHLKDPCWTKTSPGIHKKSIIYGHFLHFKHSWLWSLTAWANATTRATGSSRHCRIVSHPVLFTCPFRSPFLILSLKHIDTLFFIAAISWTISNATSPRVISSRAASIKRIRYYSWPSCGQSSTWVFESIRYIHLLLHQIDDHTHLIRIYNQLRPPLLSQVSVTPMQKLLKPQLPPVCSHFPLLDFLSPLPCPQ